MGEPLTHPDIYEMLAAVKAQGWGLTLMTNLVAADIERLAPIGIDQVLVGVQGASPTTHMAFHPGWTEDHFFKMCAHLRALARVGEQLAAVYDEVCAIVADDPALLEEFFGLTPVQRAAELCGWLRTMVDSGDIYHPLRWLPADAYQFLTDVPKLEAAGIIVRAPGAWHAGRPGRPAGMVPCSKCPPGTRRRWS